MEKKKTGKLKTTNRERNTVGVTDTECINSECGVMKKVQVVRKGGGRGKERDRERDMK